MISVVIPTWNCQYIGEALESLANQTFKGFEVIVIDDGSSREYNARLNEIVCDYEKKFDVRLYTLSHRGIASALNAGIRIMKGDWFKWLSADDVLLPDALQILDSASDLFNEKIYYTDFLICNEKMELIEEAIQPSFNTNIEFLEQLCKDYKGNASTSLIHKDCFKEKGMFNEEISLAEDYEMWIRLASKYKFQHIPRFTLNCRIHKDSNTAKRIADLPENNEKMKAFARAYRGLLE